MSRQNHLFAFIPCSTPSRSTTVSATDALITPWSELEIFDCLRKIWKLHVFYLLWDVHVLDCRHSSRRCRCNASLQSEQKRHMDDFQCTYEELENDGTA
jgi:hypothetical protein